VVAADRPVYEHIADMLRTKINGGVYPPDSTLPSLSELRAEYGVALGTVRQAIQVLADEGLVDPVRRRGTVVRAALRRETVVRERMVFRDDRGYYFDRAAQHWVAVTAPTIHTAPPPHDIATLLGTQPGQAVLIRDRIMGDPQTGRARHLSVSYLPPWLVDQLPILGQPDTGPGGIYDRIEEAGLGDLTWEERIGARAPSVRERQLWPLPSGTPVLRLVRITRVAARVCEINETTMPADEYEIGYPLTPHGWSPQS
jgi:GntR family transcriptional regulator